MLFLSEWLAVMSAWSCFKLLVQLFFEDKKIPKKYFPVISVMQK